MVIENGKYTFTVKEILTGKTYSKTVEVNDSNDIPKYFVDAIYTANRGTKIYLSNPSKEQVDFQKAYIIYQGEKIDITDCISGNEIQGKRIYANDIYDKLRDLGKLNDSEEEWKIWHKGTVQKIEIIKNGMSYFGEVELQTVPG